MAVAKSNTKLFYVTLTAAAVLLQITTARADSTTPDCSGTLTFNGISMCGTNFIAGTSAFYQCNSSTPGLICNLPGQTHECSKNTI